MTLKVKKSGAMVDVTTRRSRRSGGAWVALVFVKRRVSGAWVNAWVMAHTVVASAISAVVANGTTTRTSTATVSGGIGPYTYAWTWESGGTGMALSNTTTATVTVQSTGTNVIRSGILRCTVTDTGNGSVTSFDTANVEITHGTPV